MTKSQLWAALWMAALISELLVFNFDSLLILSLYHNGIKALEAEALLQERKLSQLFFPQYPLLIKSHIILRTAYSLILAFHCSCLKPSSWHTFLTPLMNKGLLWVLSSVIQFSSLYSPSPWICWIWISVCTSPLSIFQPPQPHSLWLPPDSVKDDKENNKPSIYVISCNMMFSQCRGCEQDCSNTTATCMQSLAVQIWFMEHHQPLLLLYSTAFFPYTCCMDWLHNLFTLWQILNRKHQTIE